MTLKVHRIDTFTKEKKNHWWGCPTSGWCFLLECFCVQILLQCNSTSCDLKIQNALLKYLMGGKTVPFYYNSMFTYCWGYTKKKNRQAWRQLGVWCLSCSIVSSEVLPVWDFSPALLSVLVKCFNALGLKLTKSWRHPIGFLPPSLSSLSSSICHFLLLSLSPSFLRPISTKHLFFFFLDSSCLMTKHNTIFKMHCWKIIFSSVFT